MLRKVVLLLICMPYFMFLHSSQQNHQHEQRRYFVIEPQGDQSIKVRRIDPQGNFRLRHLLDRSEDFSSDLPGVRLAINPQARQILANIQIDQFFQENPTLTNLQMRLIEIAVNRYRA
ncbi:hypothetical protein KBC04_03195 [Candidatus Babeliales bacterium]|nr:hypothetical protein [Candidatus Babeliales bacterium]MBP9843943.1 hypothetical protein [Candidatus Babeliales bacterium]